MSLPPDDQPFGEPTGSSFGEQPFGPRTGPAGGQPYGVPSRGTPIPGDMGPGPYPADAYVPGAPPLPPVGYAAYGVPPPGSGHVPYAGLAIAGFVLAIVAMIPCFWIWFLQVPALLGLIFSFIGLSATKSGARRGRGLAIAGVVVSLVAIVATVALTAYIYTSDDCTHDGLTFHCETGN